MAKTGLREGKVLLWRHAEMEEGDPDPPRQEGWRLRLLRGLRRRRQGRDAMGDNI